MKYSKFELYQENIHIRMQILTPLGKYITHIRLNVYESADVPELTDTSKGCRDSENFQTVM